MGYQEISIKPAHGGFGEYDCSPDRGEIWADLNDLLDESRSNVGDVYELGTDELPAPIEDIRGRIHCEPPHIYAYLDADGSAHYFGIDEA